MWTAKFEFDGSSMLFGACAKRFRVELSGYPIGLSLDKEKFLVNIVGSLRGDEHNYKKLILHLKKSRYIKQLQTKDNFILMLIEEDIDFKPFYDAAFVYVSPVVITPDGYYHYHVASWSEDALKKLLRRSQRVPGYKLRNITKENIDSVSIFGTYPDLTAKQKAAYELAVRNGYYEYPKRIELKELADLSGIAYATYQQHLRYAERKLSRYFIRQ